MARFSKQLPLLGFAILNTIYIDYTEPSSILIISLMLFLSGYIIFKIIDIFGFCDEGIIFSDSLEIIGLITLLCIYCIAVTVKMTNQIAFIPLAILDIVSGYFAAQFRYEDDPYYEDEDEEDDDDNNDE